VVTRRFERKTDFTVSLRSLEWPNCVDGSFVS